MSQASHDTEVDSPLNELEALVMAGQLAAPQAESVWQRLRDWAARLEASGAPDADERLSGVWYCAAALARLGGCQEDREGASRQALPYAQRAVEARPNDVERRNLLASLHYNLGTIYAATDRLADAEAAFRAALPLQEANVRERPDLLYYRDKLAETCLDLGNTCTALRRDPEAAEWFRRAREVRQRLVEEEPQEARDSSKQMRAGDVG
jgi:tetratricopeptide (TPR) repeat protein